MSYNHERHQPQPNEPISQSAPPDGPPNFNAANCSCKCRSCTCHMSEESDSSDDDGAVQNRASGCPHAERKVDREYRRSSQGVEQVLVRSKPPCLCSSVSDPMKRLDLDNMSNFIFTHRGQKQLDIIFNEAARRFPEANQLALREDPGTPDSNNSEHGGSSYQTMFSSIIMDGGPPEDIVNLLLGAGGWRGPSTPLRPPYYFTRPPLRLCATPRNKSLGTKCHGTKQEVFP